MIGETIGKYQITAKLGEGGMGVVYKATDVTLDREVAIKMLHPTLTTEPEIKTRFHNEAKINAKLNHPAIITLYDFFYERNSYFIVMEFVQGKTGEDIVMEIGPIPHPRLLPIFRQVISGLAYAHKQGVVHRDIKPSNIIITDPGDVKIMDFGIARIVGSQRMTSTGVAVGSILYMSPEQIKNQNVDHRSDIYALGITLFEMATGKVPFDSSAGSEYEIMQKHIEAVVPSPKSIYPHIPENIESAIIKATQKAPGDRFQTMEEFGAALDMGKVEATPSPASTKFEIPPQKPVIDDKGTSKPSVETKKRSPMALIVGIIIILLVTGGGIYFYMGKKEVVNTVEPTVPYLPEAPKPLPKPEPVPISYVFNFKAFYQTINGLSGELKEGDSLTSEDYYYLSVNPEHKLYLYIAQIDTAGAICRMFPNADFSTKSNPLPSGMEYRFPEKEYFYLDENKGRESIYVIASDSTIEKVEDIYRELVSADNSQRKQLAEDFKEVFNQQPPDNVSNLWFWHK